jgi:hypothetical protein
MNPTTERRQFKPFPWIPIGDAMPDQGWEIEWRDADENVKKLSWDANRFSVNMVEWRPSFRAWNAVQLRQALELCTSGVNYGGCAKGLLIETLGHYGPFYARDWKPFPLTRAVLTVLPLLREHQRSPTRLARLWECRRELKAVADRILSGAQG